MYVVPTAEEYVAAKELRRPRNFWRGFTPSVFLRHVTPMWFLEWLVRHFGLCQLNVVMWKQLEASDVSWWVSSECLAPYDYCGKFQKELDAAGQKPTP